MHPSWLLLSFSNLLFISTRILTKCVCIDFTEVIIVSLTLSTSSHTVSCFFINYQWTVVPRAPCQMDGDATPALLLGAESLTPVTQGTWGLQVVLVEHVSQITSGLGLIQLVHVSPHYAISHPLHTDYKQAKITHYLHTDLHTSMWKN